VLRRLPPVLALLAVTALAAPAAAGAVSAGGTSEDPIVVVSGDVTVARGETVDGVFLANGDARIAGDVNGEVVVLSGDALVSGRIDGDLFTADGTARLLPSAEVTGDVEYGGEHPQIALDARVHGDVTKQDWPDLGGLVSWVGGFVVWLAVSLSLLALGALLLLIAPRAADALEAQSRQRLGRAIAIGIAIAIVLPVLAFIAAITLLGIPLALVVGLALLPLGAVAYLVSAYALGRRMVPASRARMLALLAGLGVLRLAAYVPILGLLTGLAALVLGLGLIGTAIGASREASNPTAPRIPGS
jgi:cytoskeletal protein CcmA (bactofilin family)